MTEEIIFRDNPDRPEIISIDPKHINDLSYREPEIISQIKDDQFSLTCFQNSQLNSRSSSTLPEGSWRSHLKKDIYPGFDPLFILQISGGIYLRGKMLWMLLDGKVNDIGTGMCGPGACAYILTKKKQFIQNEPNGDIGIHSLDTGDIVETFVVSFGTSMERTYFHVFGNKIFAAGSAMPKPGLPPDKQKIFSSIELLKTASTSKENKDIIETAFIESSEIEGDIKPVMFNSSQLLVAGFENNVIVAEENRILFFDTSLQVDNLIKGEFKPITMSVDEMCRMHMIVSVDGKFELWIVNREGGRECTIPLFKPFDQTEIPPIIGFDHTVYLVTGNRIMAARPNGEILYVLPVKNSIKGAIITQDDKLLVTEEKEVAYFTAEGERNKLFGVEDEMICTPPVLSQEGKISFATDKNLYSIEAEK